MKRSVAILGHTPQFIRWAIWHDCLLRQLSPDRLAHDSFRTLRGLREFSMARNEGRLIDGVCIHASSSSQDVKNVRGFFDSEVLDAHGDEAHVDSCCNGCPANALASDRDSAPRSSELWCGCYGWLFADDDYRFDTTTEASEPRERATNADEQCGFVTLVDEAIELGNLVSAANELFVKTNPRWYGIWQSGIIRDKQAEFLHAVFTRVENLVQQRAGRKPNPDLSQLISALSRCCEHNLAMHVELVPPGYSDGQHWTISKCCPSCKFEFQTEGEQSCPACKRFGNPHELRRNKVLGLRPYVHLEGVVGAEKTAELLKKYEDRN